MSNLNPAQFPERRAYYHGTSNGIEGGVVRPNVPNAYRKTADNADLMRPAAYASSLPRDAVASAGHRASMDGKLFGSVYEVEPKVVIGTDGPHKYGVPSPTGVSHHIADPEGLDVVRHAAFVSHDRTVL